MIRGLKALIALGALTGAGFALRWVTAGAMAEASTRDLISMAFVAVAAVAWTAYAWLLLAVLATVLEQAPGVLGRAGAALAGRITSQTSRTLLRSALGVAAVTPLTIGVAHASPANPPQHTTTSGAAWRATEPSSTVRLDQPISPNEWRLTEKPSTIRLTDPPVQSAGRPQYEPSSKLEIGKPSAKAGTTRPDGPATPGPSDSSTTRTGDRPGGEGVARPGDQASSLPGEQASAGPGEQAASRPGESATSRPGESAGTRSGAGTGRVGEQAEAQAGDQLAGEAGTTLPGSTRRGDAASDLSGDPVAGQRTDGLGRSEHPPTTNPGGPARAGDPTATQPGGPARAGESGTTQPGGTARAGEPGTTRPGGTARTGEPGTTRLGGTARTGEPVGPRAGEPGIRVPDRPTDGAPVRYTDLESGRHVVLRGESLWSIAAAELGAGASESAIAARWPHWYAANRAVIGPDPDLLLPGQVLQSPASLDRPVPQTPQEK
ncbi:hypothetical protein GCM10028799_63740 [Kribbella italica]